MSLVIIQGFLTLTDNQRLLRILENDLILKHDCIWPHGLNFCLHIDSLLEVSEFRKSCQRHHWPPDADGEVEPELNLEKLRQQVHTMNTALIARNGGDEGGGGSNASSAASTPSTVRPRIATSSAKQTLQDLYDELDESASMISAQTYTVNTPGMSAVDNKPGLPLPDEDGGTSRDKTPTRTGGRSPAPSTKSQRPGSGNTDKMNFLILQN